MMLMPVSPRNVLGQWRRVTSGIVDGIPIWPGEWTNDLGAADWFSAENPVLTR
jgi:hypothetical protein